LNIFWLGHASATINSIESTGARQTDYLFDRYASMNLFTHHGIDFSIFRISFSLPANPAAVRSDARVAFRAVAYVEIRSTLFKYLFLPIL